jgi:hypothetical protein
MAKTSSVTEPTNYALVDRGKAFLDKTINSVAEVTGRLAVLERLSELMQANASQECCNQVDFGGVREEAFWYGLMQLAREAAQLMGDIELHANTMYDAKKGGAR